MKIPYYMIAHGNDFIRVTKNGRVKIVDWDGSKYQDKAQAEIVQGNLNDAAVSFKCLSEPLKVIVVTDEVRARIKS